MKIKVFGLMPLVLVAIIAYGYISNIVYLVGLDNFVLTGRVVLSCIGVVIVPLGAIMGFIN